MKSIIALVATVSLAFTAYAGTQEKSFDGAGTWKTTEGEMGTHTAKLKLTKDPEQPGVMQMHCEYTIQKEDSQVTMTTESTLTHQENGFILVQGPEGMLGTGFCFEYKDEEGNLTKKSCHLSASNETMSMETTMVYKNHSIYRIGTHTHEGVQIAWEDKLYLSVPELK